MVYLILIAVFSIGYILGAVSLHYQIRKYREVVGMEPDYMKPGTIHFM